MKKKYFTIIITVLTLTSLSCESYQKEYSDPIVCNQLKTWNGLTTFDGKKFSGSCYVYQIFEEQDKKTDLKSFRKGVPHGKYQKFYYPSEKLDWEGYRKNGHIHGPYRKYHKNNNLAVSGKLRKGFYVGTWLYFNENGELVDEKKYGLGGEEIK